MWDLLFLTDHIFHAWLVEQRHGLEVSAMNIYYTGEEAGVPTFRFKYDHKSADKTIAGVDGVLAAWSGASSKYSCYVRFPQER